MQNLPEFYNAFEILLWSALGCEFVRRAWLLRGAVRLRCLVAAGALFLFAASDAVEITTGAWWRPWWLFVWKAACVLILGLLYLERVLKFKE